MSGRRYIGTGARGLASLLDGFAAPWLFASVYPFFTAYMWKGHLTLSAAGIGAICTALWVVEGFLLFPAARRFSGGSGRALLAAALLVPALRFNLAWGSGRFGALELFILLERPLSWAVYLAPADRSDWSGRPDRIGARIARFAPWFFGAALGSGMVTMSVRWLETDATAYLVLGGALGLVAAAFRFVSMQLLEPEAVASTGDGSFVAEPPVLPAKLSLDVHWMPVVLAFSVLAFSGLLPRELDYLSPGIGRHLAFWEPFARPLIIVSFAALVIVPAKWFRAAMIAGACLVLLSGFPVPVVSGAALLGAGFGLFAPGLVSGTRPDSGALRAAVAWGLAIFLYFRVVGFYTLGVTFSRGLLTGAALAAVLAVAVAWRAGRVAAPSPESPALPPDEMPR